MKYPNWIDEFGDIWERVGFSYVRRLRDGNIGGWFDGKGLKPSYL